jgi:hypothetical protein
MWEDICNWIEQYDGVEYDFQEYIRLLKGDAIFLSPTTWRNTLSILLDRLSDMIDVIDEKYTEIPDELPNRDEMKKYVTSETLTAIIEIINSIKQKLNIEPTTIRTFSTLEKHVDGLCDLIKALSENTLEKLMKTEWFDEYEDANKDFLENVFGIVKNDLPSLQFTVNDIIQLNEEDED